MSILLKAVNNKAEDISNMELLNQLANVLDRNREVSEQEDFYRILGLPMTKSTVKVKYLSTIHPNFRDSLIKSKIKSFEKNESLFHFGPHQYYENRPVEYVEGVSYELDEQEENYWEDLIWSLYDIVYYDKNNSKERSDKHIPLLNKCGYIKRSDFVSPLN